MDYSKQAVDIRDICKSSNTNDALGLSANLLLKHCFKMLSWFDNGSDAERMVQIKSSLQKLSGESLPNEEQLISIWEDLQILSTQHLKAREDIFNKLKVEFEKMEEAKTILTDFVEMKSQYTTEKTIEVNVNHIIVPQKTIEQSIGKVSAQKPIDYIEREIQTDLIDFSNYRELVDVMDVATGPDKPIAVYRSVAVLADLRHPIQDLYDALQIDYSILERNVREA